VLSIISAAEVDRDTYITGVLKHHLYAMGGRIDGQTISLETHGCRNVEVRLPWGIVDFSQPVVVTCNGRKRIDGPVKPGIRTLLTSAYEGWDFQHPAVVRLGIDINRDARPEK
jgi:hypothetical protein